jgi:hypothetical protein
MCDKISKGQDIADEIWDIMARASTEMRQAKQLRQFARIAAETVLIEINTTDIRIPLRSIASWIEPTYLAPALDMISDLGVIEATIRDLEPRRQTKGVALAIMEIYMTNLEFEGAVKLLRNTLSDIELGVILYQLVALAGRQHEAAKTIWGLLKP